MENNKVKDLDELKKLLSHPENLVFKSEHERAIQYFEKWNADNKNIDDVWRDGYLVFFPLYFADFVDICIKDMLSSNSDLLLSVLNDIDSPFLLREVIAYVIGSQGKLDKLLDILQVAPDTKGNGIEDKNLYADTYNKSIFEKNIHSIVAAVVLDYIVVNVFRVDYIPSDLDREDTLWENDSDDSDNIDVNTNLTRLCEVLHERKDGFYLCYHYIRKLLRHERKTDAYYAVLNSLVHSFMEKARKYFCNEKGILIEGIKPEVEESKNANVSVPLEIFVKTGCLSEPELAEDDIWGDILLNMRTVEWMIGVEGYEQALFNSFKLVYSYKTPGFYTDLYDLSLKHFDIGRIIMSQPDPIKAWKEIATMSLAGIYKMSFSYYDNQATHMRAHFEFMRVVSFRMLDSYIEMFKETKDSLALKECSEFWNVLWEEGLGYLRRFAKFLHFNEHEEDYCAILLCYYYVIASNCDKNDNTIDVYKRIINLLTELREFPLIALKAIDMMKKKDLAWKRIYGQDKLFFDNMIGTAKGLAEGQAKYSFVTKLVDSLV